MLTVEPCHATLIDIMVFYLQDFFLLDQLVKSVVQKINFLISQPKHML